MGKDIRARVKERDSYLYLEVKSDSELSKVTSELLYKVAKSDVFFDLKRTGYKIQAEGDLTKILFRGDNAVFNSSEELQSINQYFIEMDSILSRAKAEITFLEFRQAFMADDWESFGHLIAEARRNEFGHLESMYRLDDRYYFEVSYSEIDNVITFHPVELEAHRPVDTNDEDNSEVYSPPDYKEIVELADQIIGGNEIETTKVYIADLGDSGATKNSIAGYPVCVPESRWPMYKGSPMDHVLTLDLNSVPELKIPGLEGYRAIALFVSDLLENEAWGPNNHEVELIKLRQEEIDSCSDDRNQEGLQGFKCQLVELPASIFDEETPHLEEDDPIYTLRSTLSEVAVIGGKPMWIQEEEYGESIIIQFNEDFVDMNLGDAGVMYVFEDTAFWQCH